MLCHVLPLEFVYTMIGILAFLTQITVSFAESSSPSLLQRVDTNLVLQKDVVISSQITMTVLRGKREKSYSFSMKRKHDSTAIEFFSPPRDKGTKLLKDDNSIWMYFPSIEQSQRISGHMVRQGFMGGAVSYEDMMRFSSFEERYTILSSEKSQYQGVSCISMTLEGKKEDMSYPKRNICVEPNSTVIVHDQMFSSDGTPMKELEANDIQKYQSTDLTMYYPKNVTIVNLLEASLSTNLIYEEMEIKPSTETSIFTLRWLEQ